MAFVPVPQVVKGVIEWSQNAVPIVNVFHVDVGHAVTQADVDAFAAKLMTWWEVNLAPDTHTSMVFQSVTATDISVPNGVQKILTVTSSPTGGKGGDPESAQTALVVSLRTAFTGRSFRGRTYFGGLVQGYLVSAQAFDPAASAVYVANMGALITSLNAIGQILGVVSTVANHVQRVVGIITAITTLLGDTKIDTQRRRSAN